MSRLTPEQLASIARAASAEQAIAAIKALRPAAKPATAVAPAIVHKPTASIVAGSPPPPTATAKQDGGDIVALARSAGLAGMTPSAASEPPPRSQPNDDSDIVALVRAARLAGFNHQDEEQSK
jgi:hypothetical protein